MTSAGHGAKTVTVDHARIHALSVAIAGHEDALRRLWSRRGWPLHREVIRVHLRALYRAHYELGPLVEQRRKTAPWDEDPEAHEFVNDHPDGGLLVEVGDYLGVSRERVRQLERAAVARFLANTSEGVREELRGAWEAVQRRQLSPWEEMIVESSTAASLCDRRWARQRAGNIKVGTRIGGFVIAGEPYKSGDGAMVLCECVHCGKRHPRRLSRVIGRPRAGCQACVRSAANGALTRPGRWL